jgi:hypothetical protein
MQPVAMPYYPPPSQNDSTKIVIVLVVILVIIFVVIPLVLAAFIFMNIPDIGNTQTTPNAAMRFTRDTNEPGDYTGSIVAISDIVPLEDVSLTLIDESLRTSAFIDPLEEGGIASVNDGVQLTFTDANRNERLDPSDVFTVTRGSPGDTIRLTFQPTGGIIAEEILE